MQRTSSSTPAPRAGADPPCVSGPTARSRRMCAPAPWPRRVGIGRRSSRADAALAKGKLKGALVRAFKSRRSSTLAADLGDRIEAALRQALLDRLGLEARRPPDHRHRQDWDTARKGEVCLLHAADAAEDGVASSIRRAIGTGEGAEPPGVVFPSLGGSYCPLALGRENVVHCRIGPGRGGRDMYRTHRPVACFSEPLNWGGPTDAERGVNAFVSGRRDGAGVFA